MPWRQRFHITGRVQGVGFRWFTVQAARRCGVVGWVRNQPDGSVLGEAQGSKDDVAKLVAQLRRGPGLARVDDVALEQLPVVEAADAEVSFDVR